MISRREVVTAGVLGTLASAATPESAAAGQGSDSAAIAARLTNMTSQLDALTTVVQQGLLGSSLALGRVGQVRERIELYLKTSGKFPEFCDIGTAAFFDIYEWHVKHQQQIQVTRMADQRLMIQFMFTQLILRWENESSYIGIPYDK